MQIESWMHEAGMHTWTDAVANVHGRIQGQNPENPALLIGSHYDTVKDAGKYDGALGILAGIAAVKALVVQVRAAELSIPHTGNMPCMLHCFCTWASILPMTPESTAF